MEKNVAILFLLIVGLFFFSMPVWWVKLTGSTRLWYPAVKLFRQLFLVSPRLIYAIPSGLLLLSWLAALSNVAMDSTLLVVTIIYLFMPTSFIVLVGFGRASRAKSLSQTGEDSPENLPKFSPPLIPPKESWVDFFVMLMLWIPLEYGMTSGFLKKYFGESAHVLSWGGGVILALFLFSAFRCMWHMKICLPTEARDIVAIVIGFMVSAATLIPLGQLIGFIPNFLVASSVTLAMVAKRFGEIWLGVALPEEILFRSLIQNWMMQKLGASNFILFCSAVIFGASHLNNGGWPNWRYALVATVLGLILGKVFQRSTSICSSVTLHAAVITVRHFCFNGGKL